MTNHVVYVGDAGDPRLKAALGDRTFVDEFGVEWYADTLTGWFDAPGPRSDSTQVSRPGADGAIDGPVYFGARQVTVGGWLTAPDEPTLLAALDRVGSLLASGDRFDWFTVAEDGGQTRAAWVRNGGPPQVARYGLSADWSLAFYASDPRRLSAVEHTLTTGVFLPSGGFSFDIEFDIEFGDIGNTGRISVPNAGNTSADLTLTITGPVTNPRISHVEDGRSLGFTIDLADGESLVVSTKDRSVLLNGTASRRNSLTASSQWFVLSPGSNTLVFNASAADVGASLTVTYRDSWM